MPPVTAVAVKTVYVFRREFDMTAGGRSSNSAEPVAAPNRFGFSRCTRRPQKGPSGKARELAQAGVRRDILFPHLRRARAMLR